MLNFDSADPFPLISFSTSVRSGGDIEVSYADAQKHSAAVDAWLGLRTALIEESLAVNMANVPNGASVANVTDVANMANAKNQTHKPQEPKDESGQLEFVQVSANFLANQQTWIGLPIQSLLTPYTELRTILELLSPSPGSKVIDLGAGYGRMGFVMNRHFPLANFIGYEMVEPRVLETRRCAARWKCDRMSMEVVDLSSPDFAPEPADFYFLYDFGSRQAIEKTLGDLRKIATSREICVVGRGGASRDAIERRHPWLSQVVAPKHFKHFSIYRTAIG